MPPQRVVDDGDPMPEPEFTPRNASDVLRSVAGYEDALRRRTEGITWMIWGIVSPMIFFSYAALYSLFDAPAPRWVDFAAVPWVTAGVFTTVALWRSVALAMPSGEQMNPSGWAISLAWVGVVAVAWAISIYARPGLYASTFFLLWIGTVWTLFGAINLYRCSPVGRRVSVAIGLATLAVAVASAVAFPRGTQGGEWLTTGVSMAASGLLPLMGGFWQTLRG